MFLYFRIFFRCPPKNWINSSYCSRIIPFRYRISYKIKQSDKSKIKICKKIKICFCSCWLFKRASENVCYLWTEVAKRLQWILKSLHEKTNKKCLTVSVIQRKKKSTTKMMSSGWCDFVWKIHGLVMTQQ